MVSYAFLKSFVGKKVLLNIVVNNNSERFYTGFLKEADDASESVLFEDKFKIMMSVNASNVTKVEEFDENRKKNENGNHNHNEEDKPPEPAKEISEEEPNELTQDDFLEPQKPLKRKNKEAK